MQPGKGGHLRHTLPVVVAAAIVQIPPQHGRLVALLFQPLGEGDAVEPPPFFRCGTQRHRHGKGFVARRIFGVAQCGDVLEKALCVCVLAGQQAAVPCAVRPHALVGLVHQIHIGIDGLGERAAALDNAQIVQHLPHMYAFGGGLRQIMRACGGVQAAFGFAERVCRLIAVALEAFGQQDVALPVPNQPPCRGQCGRAAAQNQRVAALLARMGQRQLCVAQGVCQRQADAPNRHARLVAVAPKLPPRRGCRAGRQCGIAEELSPVHIGRPKCRLLLFTAKSTVCRWR